MTFINPYTFVPKGNRLSDLSVDSIAQELRPTKVTLPNSAISEVTQRDLYAQALRHDRYIEGTYSGRIVCRLTTVSPCVFGSLHRKKGDYTQVNNFHMDVETTIERKRLAAIPSTSLKGMVSSIVEAASGSTMRVLKNHVMSIRQTMGQSRSAIGLVVGEAGKRKILPLVLPNYKPVIDEGRIVGYEPLDSSSAPVQDRQKCWHELRERGIANGQLMTAVYVGRPTHVQGCPEPAFRGNGPILSLPSQPPVLDWDDQAGSPSLNNDGPYKKNVRSLPKQVIRPAKLLPVPTVSQYSDGDDTPGILRYIRNKVIHGFNLFIPIPKNWLQPSDSGFILNYATLPQDCMLESESAIASFEELCHSELSNVPDEAGKATTTLVKQPAFSRAKKGQKASGKIVQGDLLHFSLMPDSSGLPEVETVSISSIWREGPVYLWNDDVRKQSILKDPNERPMHAKRTMVSLAERMFGWVADESENFSLQETDRLKWVPATKGRIRFSDAVSPNTLAEVEIKNSSNDSVNEHFVLPILASPKLPCPEMYLRGGTMQIRKEFFAGVSSDVEPLDIQGWKYYLIHDLPVNSPSETDYWKTRFPNANREMKSLVKPIRHGTHFYFHVEFENLTLLELQALSYALKPDTSFNHRLGAAKPLGLGVVKIEPLQIAYIDRTSRYKLLVGSRYTQVLGTVPTEASIAAIPGRVYPDSTTSGLDQEKFPSLLTHAHEFANKIGRHHQRICKLGQICGDNTTLIAYPCLDQENRESTHYNWFTRQEHNRLNNGTVKQRLNVDNLPLEY